MGGEHSGCKHSTEAAGEMPESTRVRDTCIVETEGNNTGSSGTVVRGTAEIKKPQRRQSTAVAGTHVIAAVAKRRV